MTKPEKGLKFEVVGTTTVCGVEPGGMLWLDDPIHATQLVAAGAVQVHGCSRGDEMILLEFARAGLKFDPDEWAPAKPRKGGR